MNHLSEKHDSNMLHIAPEWIKFGFIGLNSGRFLCVLDLLFHCVCCTRFICIYFHRYMPNIFHFRSLYCAFTSNLFIQLEKIHNSWTKMSTATTTTTTSTATGRKKIKSEYRAAYQCASNHCFTQYVTA